MLGDGRGGLDWLHAIVVMLIEGVESLVLECIGRRVAVVV